jgi:hypothetical protein
MREFVGDFSEVLKGYAILISQDVEDPQRGDVMEGIDTTVAAPAVVVRNRWHEEASPLPMT